MPMARVRLGDAQGSRPCDGFRLCARTEFARARDCPGAAGGTLGLELSCQYLHVAHGLYAK
eukprot:7399591-Lingulodinium_polyedra.AAC.1